MKRCTRGFTLIELLVVIAIIALLVSILLPALAEAKESAKKALCATNLKGIGTAIHEYASESNGLMPPWRINDDAGGVPGDLYPDGEFWANMLVRGKHASAPRADLSPASDNSGLFRCPSGTNEVAIAWPRYGNGDTNTHPHLFNWYYPFREGDDTPIPVEEVAVRTWYTLNAGNYDHAIVQWVGGNGGWNAMKPIEDFKRASSVVLGHEGHTANSSWQPCRVAGRHKPTSADGRHGTSNVVFLDGHVDPMLTTSLETNEASVVNDGYDPDTGAIWTQEGLW